MKKNKRILVLISLVFLLLITFSIQIYASGDYPFDDTVYISPFWFGRINYADDSIFPLNDDNFSDVNLISLNDSSFSPIKLTKDINETNNLFIFGTWSQPGKLPRIIQGNINNIYAINTNFKYNDTNNIPFQYTFRLIK